MYKFDWPVLVSDIFMTTSLESNEISGIETTVQNNHFHFNTSFRVCFFDSPHSLEDFKIVVWR